MSHKDLKPETICQVGFIVRDIEHTAQKFCEVFGFPKPAMIVTPGHERSQTTCRGQPSEAAAKLVFFNAGQIQLELIEPDEKPSVARFPGSTRRRSAPYRLPDNATGLF
jgi:methylmalonyl-CoA/ethylmalonyl-CoA epimerase